MIFPVVLNDRLGSWEHQRAHPFEVLNCSTHKVGVLIVGKVVEQLCKFVNLPRMLVPDLVQSADVRLSCCINVRYGLG